MARRTDALGEAWGPDGTQPSAGSAEGDALRAPEVGLDATATPTTRRSTAPGAPTTPRDVSPRNPDPAVSSRRQEPDVADRDALGPVPLPRLPAIPAADDPSAHAAVERWMDDDRTAYADDPPLRPHRVLPPTPPPAPPARRPVVDDAPPRPRPDQRADDPHEDPTVRAQREEREFEAQFGQWRAPTGATPPMRRSTLVSPSVLLLAFVLLVVLYYAVLR